MRVLVLGASGMVGHMVFQYLGERGYDTVSLPFRLPKDINGLSFDYDVVVNCVGMLVKDSEENPAQAVYLNSYLPHYLAGKAKRLIHISTDCVIDDSFYGRTKALGEVVNNKDLTLRMSVIGPDTRPEGTGLLNWFMQQEGTVDGYARAYWNGVTSLELAKVISKAIDQNLTGIYSPLSDGYASKLALLEMLGMTFDKKTKVVPVEKGEDKTLIESRQDFDYTRSTVGAMLIELKEWMNVHKEFYSHYSI